MKRLTQQQKVEALTNALRNFKFPKNLFIEKSDSRIGNKFAIASKTDNGGLEIHSDYMTYEEINCYLMGYNKAKTNPFRTIYFNSPSKFPKLREVTNLSKNK